MKHDLIDVRMNDGSRNFCDLPETADFETLRTHAGGFAGAEITRFLTDEITEVWIDFSYRGHRFSINNQYGDYWFFVDDPECPDEILTAIREHFAVLLEK